MPYFHGSPVRDSAPAFGSEGNTTPRITPGRPFFITEDIAFAEFFARGGLVSEVQPDLTRLADLQDTGLLDRLLGVFNEDAAIVAGRGVWDEDLDGDIADSSYFLLESADVCLALLAEGFTSARCIECVERKVYSIALLCPTAVLDVKLVNSPMR